MSKREADFSNKTKLTIAYRCKNLCSNPECRINTLQATENGEYISIGRACHIEAASKGGARYNPNVTPEERKSIENAIWLCANCADLIDKNKTAYPVELLKKWKKEAEGIAFKNNVRIFAVANQTGGVGKSTVMIYLAKAFSILTDEKILCISASADNGSSHWLLESMDDICLDIMKTREEKIDYLGDKGISKLFTDQMMSFGSFDLDKIIKKGNYKFIFIDCGNGESLEKRALFYKATDIIIPIGEHSLTDMGIHTVGEWLKTQKKDVLIWPVFSLGLTFSNKLYRRYWFRNVCEEINKIDKLECATVKMQGIIIPKTNYMKRGIRDIFNDSKTRHVTEAYLDLANMLLDSK